MLQNNSDGKTQGRMMSAEQDDTEREHDDGLHTAQRLMDEAVAIIGNALVFAADAAGDDARRLGPVLKMQRVYELAGVAREDIYNC